MQVNKRSNCGACVLKNTPNQRIQQIVKSVAIFAKQKYAPLLPPADACRYVDS